MKKLIASAKKGKNDMRATLKDIKGFNVFFPSNRFVLFDKNGNEINAFELSKLPNVLDLSILETKESSFTSHSTFVSFPTLHIKLDIEDKNLLCGWSKLKFGQSQIEWGN